MSILLGEVWIEMTIASLVWCYIPYASTVHSFLSNHYWYTWTYIRSLNVQELLLVESALFECVLYRTYMPALFTCDLKYKMAKTRIKEIFAGSVYTIVIWFFVRNWNSRHWHCWRYHQSKKNYKVYHEKHFLIHRRM